MRRVDVTVLLGLTGLAAVSLSACGGSTSGTAAGSRSTTGGTHATSTTGSGALTLAQFNALDPCTTLSTSQMEALVGGTLSGNPSSTKGPGPHECQFAATVNGGESPGSIQIAYFPPGTGQTPTSWIDSNESGYHPQSESGVGDYAVFDSSLKETQVAKGPVAIVVSGSSGSSTSDVETLQAQTAAAIIQKIFG